MLISIFKSFYDAIYMSLHMLYIHMYMTSHFIEGRKIDVFDADGCVVVEVNEKVDSPDVRRSDVI